MASSQEMALFLSFIQHFKDMFLQSDQILVSSTSSCTMTGTLCMVLKGKLAGARGLGADINEYCYAGFSVAVNNWEKLSINALIITKERASLRETTIFGLHSTGAV